jgi:hypothetical protein
MTDHDPGDEDRAPVIRDWLDLLAAADAVCVRRLEWVLTLGATDLCVKLIEESKPIDWAKHLRNAELGMWRVGRRPIDVMPMRVYERLGEHYGIRCPVPGRLSPEARRRLTRLLAQSLEGAS